MASNVNRVTRFNYDALGRLANVIDSNNVTAEQYTYTSNGLPATFIDARGNTTRTIYDGFDRTSQNTYAYGTGLASSESFTYDADDNLKTRVTRKGALAPGINTAPMTKSARLIVSRMLCRSLNNVVTFGGITSSR